MNKVLNVSTLTSYYFTGSDQAWNLCFDLQLRLNLSVKQMFNRFWPLVATVNHYTRTFDQLQLHNGSFRYAETLGNVFEKGFTGYVPASWTQSISVALNEGFEEFIVYEKFALGPSAPSEYYKIVTHTALPNFKWFVVGEPSRLFRRIRAQQALRDAEEVTCNYV